METGNTIIDAQAAFSRERRRRRLRTAADWLLRRSGESRRLAYLEQPGGARGRQVGLRAIPLASIAGTIEAAKARAFDKAFRPPRTSRRRWERIWVAGRRGAPLPPIAVFQVGARYFVSDGHHRVSVARALGMTAIDAEVAEFGR